MGEVMGWLSTAFVIWMVIECIRRRQWMPWIFIILFFHFFGALAYFIVEVQTLFPIPGLSSNAGRSRVRFRSHRVTGAQVREAETEVRRLDNAASWSDLAVVYGAKKRWQESEEAAAKALEKDSDELEARYARGRALFELGRHAEAIAELETVLAKDPGHDYGDARLALAKAHEASGDLETSLKHYEGLAAGSSRPDVLYHLALVQSAKGDKEAARATLRRILDEADLAPGFARAQLAPWVGRAKRGLKAL